MVRQFEASSGFRGNSENNPFTLFKPNFGIFNVTLHLHVDSHNVPT